MINLGAGPKRAFRRDILILGPVDELQGGHATLGNIGTILSVCMYIHFTRKRVSIFL